MAIAVMSWLVAIPLLGFATGLRCMTGIAIVCWFAYIGQLPVEGTWAAWTATLTAAVIFTLCALAEYVADKLPNTPNRIAPVGLIARIIFGGLTGAIAATGLDGSALEGIILGTLCAPLGAFVGFHVRHELVVSTGWRDWTVALSEDALTLLCAIFALGIITG